jgi:UPF0755 protein
MDDVPVDKRLSPRSPRAALEPEDVPRPQRRSRRARNPFVIAGNLFVTVLFLLTVATGVAFVIGKQRFEQPGPLEADKIVNIPRGGIRDTAELLTREGVIDQPFVFIAGALMMKTHNDLKHHHRRQGGAAPVYGRGRADLRADRAEAAREHGADWQYP